MSYIGTTNINKLAWNNTTYTKGYIGNQLLFSGSTPTPILPPEYQQVVYIQSSGKQYINTNYYHNTKNTIYDMEVEITYLPSTYNTLFGARQIHNGNEAYYLGIYNANKSLYSCIGGNKVENLGINISLNTKYHIVSDGTKGFTINGTLYNDAYRYIVKSSYRLYIFALNQYNSKTEPIGMKLYSFKIYETETEIANYIPCYRKSDNVIGMYDTIGQTFYTNAGSGTFTKGPNVN